jgi:catechol 2,3-dioxygenase-like lactoylglutathione lyase family enzyme
MDSTNRVTPLITPMRLSHGTMECRSLAESRPFYEEFLGLECVQHGPRSMLLRRGGYWSIVCIEVGDKVHPMGLWNHWGLDLSSSDEVMQAHELAHAHKDRFGLEKITQVGIRHGTYQFHFRDRDGNWWEFQYVGEEARYDRLFREGDVVPMNKSTQGEVSSNE